MAGRTRTLSESESKKRDHMKAAFEARIVESRKNWIDRESLIRAAAVLGMGQEQIALAMHCKPIMLQLAYMDVLKEGRDVQRMRAVADLIEQSEAGGTKATVELLRAIEPELFSAKKDGPQMPVVTFNLQFGGASAAPLTINARPEPVMASLNFDAPKT